MFKMQGQEDIDFEASKHRQRLLEMGVVKGSGRKL